MTDLRRLQIAQRQIELRLAEGRLDVQRVSAEARTLTLQRGAQHAAFRKIREALHAERSRAVSDPRVAVANAAAGFTRMLHAQSRIGKMTMALERLHEQRTALSSSVSVEERRLARCGELLNSGAAEEIHLREQCECDEREEIFAVQHSSPYLSASVFQADETSEITGRDNDSKTEAVPVGQCETSMPIPIMETVLPDVLSQLATLSGEGGNCGPESLSHADEGRLPSEGQHSRQEEFCQEGQISDLSAWEEGGGEGLSLTYRTSSGSCLDLSVMQDSAEALHVSVQAGHATDGARIARERGALSVLLCSEGFDVLPITVRSAPGGDRV